MKKLRHLIIVILCILLCGSAIAKEDLAVAKLSDNYPRKLILQGEEWVKSSNAGNQKNKGLGFLTMARGYSLLGDEEKAISTLRQAIKEFTQRGDGLSIAEAKLQWADILISMGRFQQTVELCVSVIDYGENQKDTTYIALGYNGLGTVFRNFHEYSKAKKYFELALELSLKSNEDRCLSVIYKNLGTYNFYLKNYKEAFDFYSKSFLYWKDKGIHEDKCGILNNQGNVLREQGKLTDAIAKYNQALEMADSLGSVYMHTVILKNLGVVAVKQNEYKKAFTLLDNALIEARKHKLRRIQLEILKQEALLNAELGNYKLSNQQFLLFEQIQDSIINEYQFQDIIKSITKVETEKDESKIVNLQKNLRVEKLTNTRNYLYLAIIFLILTIVLMIIVYHYLSKLRVNQALEKQRDEIVLQKEELSKLNIILQRHNEESESVVKERTFELQHINELLRAEIDERKKAVQSLHDYQAYLLELLNSVADPIFVKDEMHKWVLLNDAAINIIGMPRDELLGKSDYDIFPEAEAKVFWEKDDEVLQNGIENVNEEEITTVQGDTHLIETKKKLYINKQGEKFIVGIINEITEQRKLQQQIISLNQNLENKILERTHQLQLSIANLESEIEKRKAIETELIENREKLNNLLENIPLGIMHIDKKGQVQLVNRSFIKILDISEDDLGGKSMIFDYLSFTEPFMMDLLDGLIHKKEAFNLDSQYFKTEKGRYIYVHCRGVPLTEKNEEFFTIILSDVSERRMISDELVQQKEKAEEASRLKTNFLSNMSHEIRTPLTGILGYAELLNEEIFDDYKAAMVQKIVISGKRLLSTLDAVLLLSRLQSGQVTPSIVQINIETLLTRIIDQYRPLCEAKDIRLTYNPCPLKDLDIDKTLFTEVINQLLDNALKFTKAGEINVFMETDANDGCLIGVSDTGIGIDEDQKEFIFDDFRQVSEGWGRSFEGSGIGLSIAKRIIELMGGRIWAESKAQPGSVFKIWLPVS